MACKSCPFRCCPRRELEVYATMGKGPTRYYIFCLGCGACGPLADTEEEAERFWNERRES